MPHDNHPDPESPADDCLPNDSYPRLVDRLVTPGEDPREFRKLYNQLEAEWQPQGATEWITFTMILRSHWTCRRLDAMEAYVYETIGRIVWDQNPDLSIAEALHPANRRARVALNRIARLRTMREKTLARAERHLRKMQELHRRNPKPATAAGPNLADLEPGSNLIQ